MNSIIIKIVLLSGFIIHSTHASLVSDILNEKLPKGVPLTTASNGLCFLSDEYEALKKEVTSNKNTLSIASCSERFIKPKKTIQGAIYYTPGSSGSITDCKKYRINKYYSMNITMAVEQIQEYADNKLNSSNQKIRSEASQCLANVFNRWASDKAMTQRKGSTDQPYYYQMWYSGALASLYAKYSSLRYQINKKGYLKEIRSWFDTIAKVIANRIKYPAYSPYGTNNMQYSRGYSLLAIAIVTRNNEYLDLSYGVFKEGLSSVTNGVNMKSADKGFLPAELQRKNRAQTYHEGALKPLLGMLMLSKSINCSFMDNNKKRWSLALLMRKIIEGNYHPELFDDASYKLMKSLGKPVTRQSVIQANTKTAENLINMLGYGKDRLFIVPKIDEYLSLKNIVRRVDFSDGWYQDWKIGGDFRYLPKEASVYYPKKRPSFCKDQTAEDAALALDYFSSL